MGNNVKGLRMSSKEEYVACKTWTGQVTLPVLSPAPGLVTFLPQALPSLCIVRKADPLEHPHPRSSTLMTSTSTVPLPAPSGAVPAHTCPTPEPHRQAFPALLPSAPGLPPTPAPLPLHSSCPFLLGPHFSSYKCSHLFCPNIKYGQ